MSSHYLDLPLREFADVARERNAIPERWRPVVGFEGAYEVSDLGRVRSVPRENGYGRKLKGVVLATKPTAKCGYVRPVLAQDGKVYAKKMHRLVLEAFVGPAPEGTEACHNNGDRSDNRLVNLRWDTRSANSLDAIRHGTSTARLTADNVRAIKSRIEAGEPDAAISKDFGVHPATIWFIRSGRHWGHVR